MSAAGSTGSSGSDVEMVDFGLLEDDDGEDEGSQGSGIGVHEVDAEINDILVSLFPKSSHFYKYRKNGTSHLALIWLLGNLRSTKSIVGKYRKLKNTILTTDLLTVSDVLADHIPVLLQPDSLETARKYNVNCFNRFYKVGMLLHGLANILNIQLKACQIDLNISYGKLKRGSPAEEAINVPLTTTASTKHQQDASAGFLEVVNNVDMDIGRMGFSLETSNCDGGASPRRVARFAENNSSFEEQKLTPPERFVESRTTQPRRRKVAQMAQNNHRIPKRAKNVLQEADIMMILLKSQSLLDPSDVLNFVEEDLPNQSPIGRNDFFDRTELPRASIPEIDEVLEHICVDGPSDMVEEVAKNGSPVHVNRPSQNVPPPPRKSSRRVQQTENEIDSFVLEPVANVVTGKFAKSPRTIKRRRLQFNDEKTKMSILELQTRVKTPDLTDAERKITLGDRIHQPASYVPAGLLLIESFGRKCQSSRLLDMTKSYLSSSSVICREFETTRHQDLSGSNVSTRSRKSATSIDSNGESRRVAGSGLASVNFNVVNENPQVNIEENNLFSEAYVAPGEEEQEHGNFQDYHQQNQHAEDFQADPGLPTKTFDQIVGPSANRLKACHAFGVLLRMQGQRKITLTQEEWHGPITVQQLGTH